MLSRNEKQVQSLIEARFSGVDKEEAFLFHISVERKLESVKLWLQNVEKITPDLIQFTSTSSAGQDTATKDIVNLELTINKISAYIDAFFMSGKSTLDTFAHELRKLYGLGGHGGDLYFENAIDLLRTHHNDSQLNSYLDSVNIKNLDWYKDLNSYRRASAHESIIPIRPSLELDFQRSEWKSLVLVLPDTRNFMDVGIIIKDELNKLIIESYDKILGDINNRKTRIVL